MGGICAKFFSASKHSQESGKKGDFIKERSGIPVKQMNPSDRNENIVNKGGLGGDKQLVLTDAKATSSGSARGSLKITSILRAIEGEQVAAGWPPWLAMADSEAIRGWIPRSASTFKKIERIGKGGYSTVYLACDLVNKKFVALKKVLFNDHDPKSIKFMAREIVTLRRLDHPNIIKLEGLAISRVGCHLYLVLEYIEHDLSKVAPLLPSLKFTGTQVKCYMQQLLRGLDHCHSRGVLHRDIKTANLLVNNQGCLKIADFGLSTFIDHSPLTGHVVTLWYRPPEILVGAKSYGVEVDLWSTGCVLGELFVGKPILPGRTEVEQLHKIFKLCGTPSEDDWKKLLSTQLPTSFRPPPYKRRIAETFNHLPPPAVGLMDILLSIDPKCRGTAALALENEFFTTEPFSSDPNSLPNYNLTKETNEKVQEVESRGEQGKEAGIIYEGESEEIRTGPGLDDNAHLSRLLHGKQGHYSCPKRQGNPTIKLDIQESSCRKLHSVKESGQYLSEDSLEVGFLGPLVRRGGSSRSHEIIRNLGFSGPLGTGAGSSGSNEVMERHGFSGPLVTKAGNSKLQEMKRKKGFSGPSIWSQNSGLHGTNREQGLSGSSTRYESSGCSSSHVDQIIEAHDRYIQESVDRARLQRKMKKSTSQNTSQSKTT